MNSPTLRPLFAPACAAAALLCAGCLNLGPDFEPPPWDGAGRWAAPAPDADAAPDAPPPPLPGGAPWWTLFGDETLDALEAALLAQSPSLAASVARLDAAAARLGIARAEALPSAALSASTAWKRDSKEDGDDSRQKAEWLLSPGASLQWEIDFWGRVRRTREAASAEHSAAARDAGAARLLLSAQLASTYVSLRTLQAQISCAQTNEALRAQTLGFVRSRRRSGLASELDLHQAEMELAGARAAIPPLEARRDAALHAICALVGDWPGAHDALLAPAPVPAADAAALPDALPAELLRNRPDVLAALDRLHAATALVGAAEAERYPKVAIGGSFTLSASRPGSLFRSGSQAWSIGPSVEWPVLSGGRLRAQVREREAERRAAEAEFRQAVLDAAAECETALAAHRGASAALDPLRRAADEARKAAASAESLYRNGLADFRTLLDAQREQADRLDALAAGLGESSAALVDVWKAFGGPCAAAPATEDGTP